MITLKLIKYTKQKQSTIYLHLSQENIYTKVSVI